MRWRIPLLLVVAMLQPGCRRHPMSPAVTGVDPVGRVADKDACAGLSPQACGARGAKLLAAQPANARGAYTLLHAACEKGDAESCWNLGGLLSTVVDPDLHDDRAALTADQKACAFGVALACCDAGKLLQDPTNTRPALVADLSAAATLYRTGCEGGESRCCIYLSNLYLVGGQGVTKNPKLARTYLKRARSLGYRDEAEAD